MHGEAVAGGVQVLGEQVKTVTDDVDDAVVAVDPGVGRQGQVGQQQARPDHAHRCAGRGRDRWRGPAARLPGGTLGVFLVLAATVDVDVLAPSEDVLHAHSDQAAVLLGVVDPFGAAAGHVLDLAGRQLLRVRALGEVGGDQALQPTAPGTVFGGLGLQAAVTAQRAEQHWT